MAIYTVNLFYANLDAKNINSNENSDKLAAKSDIKEGIRQGCPFISASLFILVAEILTNRILRENANIHGMRIPSESENNIKELKVSQFADDTTLFLNSLISVKAAIKELR